MLVFEKVWNKHNVYIETKVKGKFFLQYLLLDEKIKEEKNENYSNEIVARVFDVLCNFLAFLAGMVS